MSTPTIITPTHFFFYSGRSFYSNWHETVNQFTDTTTGFVFTNSEAHFMYQKARFFGDELTATKIVTTQDPQKVKAYGRQIRGYDDKLWEIARLAAMTHSCYLKFSQNPEWKAHLKETGNRELVEASSVDLIWGVGLDVEEAAKEAEDQASMWSLNESLHAEVKWPGRNLLGKVLMQVRDLI